MNCILIGYGEIGRAVYDVYKQYHKIDIRDLKIDNVKFDSKYDLMIVAIPYSDNFIDTVKKYQSYFNPDATIIFSTVAIGTTAQIENAVHCPIEGKHPYLSESVKKWQVFIGGKNKLAVKFFTTANKIPYEFNKPEHTEFLKLQSTSNYGLMIEYARYLNSVCNNIGLDYDEVKKFNMAYNGLYKTLGMPNMQRYILDAPVGNIGGHCVVPNAKLLDKQYPSIFLKEIYRDKDGDDNA
jgi:hypothetical protein